VVGVDAVGRLQQVVRGRRDGEDPYLRYPRPGQRRAGVPRRLRRDNDVQHPGLPQYAIAHVAVHASKTVSWFPQPTTLGAADCEPCGPGSYQIAPCTAGSDRVCAPCTQCGGGLTFEASPCTPFANRLCLACSEPCANGTYQVIMRELCHKSFFPKLYTGSMATLHVRMQTIQPLLFSIWFCC
jgi:hypothetical protein